MHVIHEAFGKDANLYKVLNVDVNVDKAGLRKAYYKAALKFHPDKNPGETAARKFQGLTAIYQLLQNTETRKLYDETGELMDDDEEELSGENPWKDYFDRIFGRVTVDGINEFAQKYKCSDEERKDVIAQYEKCSGNLIKMLEFVMLSNERDALRWVEDYLNPAIADQTIADYSKTMEKSIKKLKAKIEKEDKQKREEEERTESEGSEDEKSMKTTATKKPTRKRKQEKKEDNMSSLIARIQKKRGGGGGAMASFASRYGITDDLDDPLADDAAFRRAQAKVTKKKNR